MTDEQRERVKSLAVTASRAETALHYAGYWSVPREADKAEAQSARYAELRAEAYEARCALEAYITTLGEPSEPWARDVARELMEAAKTAAALAA